jgi:hypothetical protein
LESAKLDEACLRRANLSDANLENAELHEADLSRALLTSTNLRGASLSEARLAGAYLFAVDLEGADLSHACLNRAYLSHANLQNANLSSADLISTDVTNVNWTHARVQDAQFGHNWGLTELRYHRLTQQAAQFLVKPQFSPAQQRGESLRQSAEAQFDLEERLLQLSGILEELQVGLEQVAQTSRLRGLEQLQAIYESEYEFFVQCQSYCASLADTLPHDLQTFRNFIARIHSSILNLTQERSWNVAFEHSDIAHVFDVSIRIRRIEARFQGNRSDHNSPDAPEDCPALEVEIIEVSDYMAEHGLSDDSIQIVETAEEIEEES